MTRVLRRDQAPRKVERRDRIQLVVDASTTVRHANGWIDAWGVSTRSGVLAYPEHGTAEFRPPDEVFDRASLATMLGVPLTIDHPDGGMVDAGNARALTHGWVLQVVPDPPLVRVQVRIATDEALAELQRGTVELSMAYEADYEPGEGVDPDSGTPYTGVQRRIRYNHLALVQLARAGHAARLTLDGKRGTKMRTITIRKHTRQVPAFLADAIAAQAAAAAESLRADASLETEEVIIGGTSLVLPKEMVAAIMAALGIGAGAPAGEPEATEPTEASMSDEDPASGEAPKEDPAAAPPRMDRAALRGMVRGLVAEALLEQRRADAVVARATEILGERPSGDTWALMAASIAHIDPERKPQAEQLAASARRGDSRAAGRLEGLMDALPVLVDPGSSRSNAPVVDLALQIDSARKDRAAADGGGDPLEEARAKAMARKLNGGKPAA